MSQTLHISEKSAVLLAAQAAARGVSLEVWIEEIAIEKAHSIATSAGTEKQPKPGSGTLNFVD